MLNLESPAANHILKIEDLTCSLTSGIFNDPVSCSCEQPHTFERDAILEWLVKDESPKNCPITRAPLQVSDLKTNVALKQFVQKVRRLNNNQPITQDHLDNLWKTLRSRMSSAPFRNNLLRNLKESVCNLKRFSQDYYVSLQNAEVQDNGFLSLFNPVMRFYNELSRDHREYLNVLLLGTLYSLPFMTSTVATVAEEIPENRWWAQLIGRNTRVIESPVELRQVVRPVLPFFARSYMAHRHAQAERNVVAINIQAANDVNSISEPMQSFVLDYILQRTDIVSINGELDRTQQEQLLEELAGLQKVIQHVKIEVEILTEAGAHNIDFLVNRAFNMGMQLPLLLDEMINFPVSQQRLDEPTDQVHTPSP